MRIRQIASFVLLSLVFLPSTTWAQNESVKPGINDSFVDPDPSQFVERFEREGREVYDMREKIVGSCKLRPDMVVADIGAGTGLFTRLIAKSIAPRGTVLAVDIAKNFVDHIQATCQKLGLRNVTGVVCTPTSANLPPKSVDLAFLCDVYHHFEYPYKTMRSIRRGLKDDGHVVLIDFERIDGESSDWILGHVRAGKETFVSEIEFAGFREIEELDLLETSYFIRFEKFPRKTGSGHTIDSLETVSRLLKKDDVVLIDVREQDEWDAGHVSSAKLLPLSRLREIEGDGRNLENVSELPKDKVIYCHCRSGGRALIAAGLLESAGYDVRPLQAGYADLIEFGFPKAQ